MKVALVHDYLREYGGGERVLEALHDIYPDAPVFTSYYFPEMMPERFKSWDVRSSVLQKAPFIESHFLWYTYFVPWVFEQFDLKEYDLVISSSHFAAKGVLTNPHQKHICYCHTPPRFLWGINQRRKRLGVLRFAFDMLNSWLRQWDVAAAARVDYFIANSRVTQERIKKFYRRDSEIIYPFVDLVGRESVGSTKGEYYLSVCRLEYLKHVDLVVETFNSLGLPLKVVGSGAQFEYLKSIAGKNVEILGFQDDERVAELYRNSKALVVAAENEDFGITPIEAFSYGKPVIAYRSGGYEETVVDGETGVFFNELTESSFTDAVKRFEQMNFDNNKISERAKLFSKERFKHQILGFVSEIQ